MPEILEAGYFFPYFILLFIITMNLLSSDNLRVIGLWCDLTKNEHKECSPREERLLHQASSLSKTALQRDRLAQWANDLEDLADAIPDTHGLLIHQVWEGLHPPIRRQISPNHASWASFCNAIRDLQYGVETVPEKLPVPWHRQRLPLYVPYKIGDRPSNTPLVVELTAQMPHVYRGRDPTQTRIPDKKKNSKKKNTNVGDVDYVNYASDSGSDSDWESEVDDSDGEVYSDADNDNDGVSSEAAPLPSSATNTKNNKQRSTSSKAVGKPSTAAGRVSTAATTSSTSTAVRNGRSQSRKSRQAAAFNALFFGPKATAAPAFAETSHAGTAPAPPEAPALTTDKAPALTTDTAPNTTTSASTPPPTLPVPQPPAPASDKHFTDYTRYYWPKYVFPALDVSGPLRSISQVGLKLKGLLYDARKTIMNMGTAYLEIEPLLHTSPQIYTTKQWEGVIRVPSSDRGFKIGLAIQFPTHVLSLNSFDNNFRIHWRTPEAEKLHYKTRYVPDPVYDYPAWCTYTAKWLARRLRKPSKTMTLVAALSKSGKHPFRGLGKYGTNDVMAIAGFFPWILFYTVLSNPVLFCILCEAFIQFITPKALQTNSYIQSALRTNPRPPQNSGNPDFALSVTDEQRLHYAESLKVHGRKRAHVTELEATLIDQYNQHSVASWQDADAQLADALSQAQIQMMLTKPSGQKGKKTASRARSAPGISKPSDFFTCPREPVGRLPSTVAFDMSSIRFAVTQYGHLGSVIAGSAWDSVLSELQSTIPLVVKQEKEYRQLTRNIDDDASCLRFKSILLLTAGEIDILANSFPWEENPIITYYRTHPTFLDHESRIHSNSLSLIRQPTRWRETKLFSTANRKGYTWSLFRPPFIIYQPKQTKWENADEPPPPIKPPVPMFTLESEHTRDAYTFSHVKEETKGYTVGPHDFVGHGHYINLGRTSFVGLCFWHESLTQAQMLALIRARDAKTRYVKGMRKMSLADTTAEKKWRTSLKSDFRKSHASGTQIELDSYIRRERKKERAGLLDVIRVLCQEEETGKRQRGKKSSPRNSARVKNRSLIKTLAKKWHDI
ncbi:hypothetical protein R3P38DRAFT_3000142 [Favolaschia claudopus]|uniref:Uncharacterized protein n=1 Tax=Favolaschia claudopus TaxID=2862362 RepID=A0AAW0ARL8_9AGAR